MAYFPNGTSFAGWQTANCSDCLNYRDNGSGSFGCAITEVHWLHSYHDGTNAEVLNSLVPDDGPQAHQCRMRLTDEDRLNDKCAADLERDMLRYEAAMAETRAAHDAQAMVAG